MENPVQVNANGPQFERCLMIWGKTAKACGAARGMDNGVRMDSVGVSTQDPLKHVLHLLKNIELQTDRFPHLQAILLKSARLHPHRGQQLGRNQWWTLNLQKLRRGEREKTRWRG